MIFRGVGKVAAVCLIFLALAIAQVGATSISATINSEECCDAVLSIKEQLQDLQKEREALHLEISRLRAVESRLVGEVEMSFVLKKEMSHLRAANDALRRVLKEHGEFLTGGTLSDSSQNYFEVLSVSTPHTYSDASSSHEFASASLPQYINDTEQRRSEAMSTEALYSGLVERTVNGTGDSDAHLMTLLGLALALKAKNILELGVRGGATTMPLLLAAKETGGRVTSVDIEDTEFVPPPHLANYWVFVKMDALVFLRTLDKSTALDLVYVDDWQSYQHVKEELAELDKAASPKTLILLHDLMYSSHPHYHVDNRGEDQVCNLGSCTKVQGVVMNEEFAGGGPYRAVAELDGSEWEFATVAVCHGLTILRKKHRTHTSEYYYDAPPADVEEASFDVKRAIDVAPSDDEATSSSDVASSDVAFSRSGDKRQERAETYASPEAAEREDDIDAPQEALNASYTSSLRASGEEDSDAPQEALKASYTSGLRHPEHVLVGLHLACFSSAPGNTSLSVLLRGLVAGIKYRVETVIYRDQHVRDCGISLRQDVTGEEGESVHSLRVDVPLPAACVGFHLAQAVAYDAFPGLEREESVLARTTSSFDLGQAPRGGCLQPASRHALNRALAHSAKKGSRTHLSPDSWEQISLQMFVRLCNSEQCIGPFDRYLRPSLLAFWPWREAPLIAVLDEFTLDKPAYRAWVEEEHARLRVASLHDEDEPSPTERERLERREEEIQDVRLAAVEQHAAANEAARVRLQDSPPFCQVKWSENEDDPFVWHSGYVRQSYSHFHADLYTTSEYVALVDTDTLFITPVTPADLFDAEGRPVMIVQVGRPGTDFWEKTAAKAEAFLKRPYVARGMANWPVVVKTKHLLALRRYVEAVHATSFNNVFAAHCAGMAHCRESVLTVGSRYFTCAEVQILTQLEEQTTMGSSARPPMTDCKSDLIFCCAYDVMASYLWYFHPDEYDWHFQQFDPHWSPSALPGFLSDFSFLNEQNTKPFVRVGVHVGKSGHFHFGLAPTGRPQADTWVRWLDSRYKHVDFEDVSLCSLKTVLWGFCSPALWLHKKEILTAHQARTHRCQEIFPCTKTSSCSEPSYFGQKEKKDMPDEHASIFRFEMTDWRWDERTSEAADEHYQRVLSWVKRVGWSWDISAVDSLFDQVVGSEDAARGVECLCHLAWPLDNFRWYDNDVWVTGRQSYFKATETKLAAFRSYGNCTREQLTDPLFLDACVSGH